ncbi:VanZ family protein [Lacticaseibacillus suilingensis]|jgi:glycopeptide antibiotics resistance protein|uniref:VanZ family protein n=1 Tax=Lacticaseibacillus suilingensis TaxID=2799577 RepID=A0ABW4BDM8_9LACO|nr:VanZ family protein [Lacticaseibacillus suilingensis]MCI1894816.1 VanZ family protein [Lactobacillus sp.]MCI2017293.1 VanZ family protein [Lactobacillus sp.]MCI2037205.1 VanZ family protein [Lactobacillus sp.]
MLFLGPVYRYVQAQLEGRINHWPLVRLIMYSLDKTLLYLALFLLLRLGLKLLFHRRFDAWHEVKVILFSAYVILLLMLTVFRQWYYPWQLHFYWERPLSAINWTPLVNTFKLRLGSQIDLWYQSFGNVLWFIPFGFGLPSLRRTKIAAWRVVGWGLLLSLAIESLQFVLASGVADIDDVIFNTIGTILGFGLWRLLSPRSRKR